MQFHWQRRELTLQHPWTLARGSATSKTYLYLSIEHEGITGLGEAAHSAYQNESLDSTETVFQKAEAAFAHLPPDDVSQAAIHQLTTGDHAAKAAIDMAILDWLAKRAAKPLSQHLGIPNSPPLPTSFAIAISEDRETLKEKIVNLISSY